MKTPMIALAAAATLLTGVPALADDAAPDMVVRYADLDLTTEAGQKTLESRIDAAAKKYCGVGEQRTGTRMKSSQATRCYRDAKRLANQQFAAIISDARRGG
ncbi:UrcA family protein [Erythrobacter sp. SDW2]|uniref:UrcA family protein n=1 Tax=Erythrobacter sp. SDW2 TaxID=2907154 RepID=UPI001F1BECAF|nr:UrcA family protein [Erythrobacter sp. SDW2]UIP07285.1 UrcA family protein [Erythrobacter sp. SDW2]